MKKSSKWLELAAQEEMNSAGADIMLGFAIKEAWERCDLPKTLLSVGCGDGSELEMWKSVKVRDITGIDLNENSVMKAREKGFTVEKMDAHDIQYPDNSFDMVFARDVFEHAVSHITMMSEMARVAKKYLIIVLPDQTWNPTPVHYIIPTLRQMMNLGFKNDLYVKFFQEYTLLSGHRVTTQSLYIFEKVTKYNAKSKHA